MEFFNVHISRESIRLVEGALKSGWVSEGRLVKRFERELSERLGFPNPVTTNSGTAALHLALAVAGVGPGDEVILPAQTFIATGLAVLMVGARPVFADIELSTGNICPDSIACKLTPNTKAIIPVHWGGYPCDMDEINELAQWNDIVVIEDAAHALGATYKDKLIGQVSDFTCFSFQAIKHLTCGDGGALCCADDYDSWRARNMRWFGISKENSPVSHLGERVYNTDILSYKYHMNDISAAVGLGNLMGINERLTSRQIIGSYYRGRLHDVPGVTLLECKLDRVHAYWLFTILVENRHSFIDKMTGYGIPVSVVHQRIDRNSVFGGLNDLPNQAKFDEHQISIPVHDGLTLDDVNYIVETIRSGW
jgi:perosamine synthetase